MMMIVKCFFLLLVFSSGLKANIDEVTMWNKNWDVEFKRLTALVPQQYLSKSLDFFDALESLLEERTILCQKTFLILKTLPEEKKQELWSERKKCYQTVQTKRAEFETLLNAKRKEYLEYRHQEEMKQLGKAVNGASL